MSNQDNHQLSDKSLFAKMIITSKEKAAQFLSKWTMEHGSSWEEGIKYLKQLGVENDLIPEDNQGPIKKYKS